MNDTDFAAAPAPAPTPAAAPTSEIDHGVVLRRAALAEIDPRTLYLLVTLRQDVFAMEQGATDADLDGRELEPGTTLMWLELPSAEAEALGLPGMPIAHLRVLHDPDGTVRIGRVAVHGAHRRSGYGRQLMIGALEHIRATEPEAAVHIDAQAYLEQWYASMGFETVGELFMEAGIEHLAMVLRPSRA